MGWRVVPTPQQKLLSTLAYFFPLKHILKRLSVSVRALLSSAVRRTLALRGPRSCFVFREMRDYVAERRQRGDRLRQSLLMTQMKYEGIVRERADRKDEGSSLITAPIDDGYVSSPALWLSRRWLVASVCFRGARRDVTARRARASARRYRRIHPALPPSFTRLFLGFFFFCQSAAAPLSQEIHYPAPRTDLSAASATDAQQPLKHRESRRTFLQTYT